MVLRRIFFRAGLASLAIAPLSALALAAACDTGSSTLPPGDGGSIFGDVSVIGVRPDGQARPQPDGGPCNPASTVSNVPPYLPVAAALKGACTSAQIAAFYQACFGSVASPQTCTSFFDDAGNSCGNCLWPIDGGTPNTGGVLVDSTGLDLVGVNTPGCIALADPTPAGTACAKALEPFIMCESLACDSPNCQVPDAGYAQCLQTAQSTNGACAMQYMNAGACNGEYVDGGAAVGACAAPTQVLEVICGAGP